MWPRFTLLHPQSLFSPDLVPPDYYPFPKMKPTGCSQQKSLKEAVPAAPKEAAEEVTGLLSAMLWLLAETWCSGRTLLERLCVVKRAGTPSVVHDLDFKKKHKMKLRKSINEYCPKFGSWWGSCIVGKVALSIAYSVVLASVVVMGRWVKLPHHLPVCER